MSHICRRREPIVVMVMLDKAEEQSLSDLGKCSYISSLSHPEKHQTIPDIAQEPHHAGQQRVQ